MHFNFSYLCLQLLLLLLYSAHAPRLKSCAAISSLQVAVYMSGVIAEGEFKDAVDNAGLFEMTPEHNYLIER